MPNAIELRRHDLKYRGAFNGRNAEPSAYLVPASHQDATFTREYVSAYMAGLKYFLGEHQVDLRHFPIIIDGEGETIEAGNGTQKTTLWSAFRNSFDFRRGYIEGLISDTEEQNENDQKRGVSPTRDYGEGNLLGKFVSTLKPKKIIANKNLQPERSAKQYTQFRKDNMPATDSHLSYQDIMNLIAEALGEFDEPQVPAFSYDSSHEPGDK